MVRAFVRAAHLQANVAGGGATAQSLLESVLLNRFNSEATDGRTLIRSEMGDQRVEFSVPADLGPGDIMVLAELGLQWLAEQPDPTNPTFTRRRIKRLRASFLSARF